MFRARTDDEAFADVRREQARAEYATWNLVLNHFERATKLVDAADQAPVSKQHGRSAVVLDMAQQLAISEQRTWGILHEARTLRDRTPRVWATFRVGRIDAAKAGTIAALVEKLRTPEAVAAVDHAAVEYAESHTLGELRSWLRRLRARLEPEQVETEAARATEERRVNVVHLDDGTSWLNALLPTGVAVAVADRLTRAARALPAIDGETGERDRRTRDQKQADLLAHWLTSCTGTETEIHAEIAISIAATDLIGLTDGPGLTLDGEPVSSEWVRELAQSEHTEFRRLVLDPVGRVMDTAVLAYRPPQSLREALRWRDGTCRVAGCRTPARSTDLDHELAYDRGGTTSADNLRCLCRRHHNMKSHGHLDDRHLDRAMEHVERYRVA
ncbi:DUF222 domain-containing protein [Aeromicrobium sp. Marseille-Q0843]|uniref:DUF222 domain-containing protein n=1 Tax=Aeromicrobium phoceense TaxID=2754045 RepID=A0A838XNG3_9ACTN|nr:HNH endonuclease signature motif containing protein [Aeromicrobium phoceense]MBA4608503.1 DUF222 domain-containing protein [Aeromicrobium phoceense]